MPVLFDLKVHFGICKDLSRQFTITLPKPFNCLFYISNARIAIFKKSQLCTSLFHQESKAHHKKPIKTAAHNCQAAVFVEYIDYPTASNR